MMLLTANSMHIPQHDNASMDIQLVDVGLRTVDRIVAETGSKVLQSFQEICAELHQRAQHMCGQAIMMARECRLFSNLSAIQSDYERPRPRDDF